MDTCIFCKIGKHEIPHYPVYETVDVLAFLDIHPTAFGHTLIIPKQHVAHLKDAPDKMRLEMLRVADIVMPVLQQVTGAWYVELMIAGVDINHFHIHLLPRYNKDITSQNLPSTTGEFEHLRNNIVETMPA